MQHSKKYFSILSKSHKLIRLNTIQLQKMKKSIHQSELMLNMNERLFLNALEGVTDEQANERLSPHNNPIIWIATHTAWARYNMLALLGSPVDNPFKGKFEGFKPYDTADNYPSLET